MVSGRCAWQRDAPAHEVDAVVVQHEVRIHVAALATVAARHGSGMREQVVAVGRAPPLGLVGVVHRRSVTERGCARRCRRHGAAKARGRRVRVRPRARGRRRAGGSRRPAPAPAARTRGQRAGATGHRGLRGRSGCPTESARPVPRASRAKTRRAGAGAAGGRARPRRRRGVAPAPHAVARRVSHGARCRTCASCGAGWCDRCRGPRPPA